MPCSVRSTSAPTVRRSPNFSSCRPRRVSAVLDLEQPGERQAHELVHRFSMGRWPLWRVLGRHREGPILSAPWSDCARAKGRIMRGTLLLKWR